MSELERNEHKAAGGVSERDKKQTKDFLRVLSVLKESKPDTSKLTLEERERYAQIQAYVRQLEKWFEVLTCKKQPCTAEQLLAIQIKLFSPLRPEEVREKGYAPLYTLSVVGYKMGNLGKPALHALYIVGALTWDECMQDAGLNTCCSELFSNRYIQKQLQEERLTLQQGISSQQDPVLGGVSLLASIMRNFLRNFELSLMETDKVTLAEVLSIKTLDDYLSLQKQGNLKPNPPKEEVKEEKEAKKEVSNKTDISADSLKAGMFGGAAGMQQPPPPPAPKKEVEEEKGVKEDVLSMRDISAGGLEMGMFGGEGNVRQPLLSPASRQQQQGKRSESSCWDNRCVIL